MTRVVVCCDGLDPAYLAATDTPGWDGIADRGRAGTCDAVVPTLTNVNNVSIVTGGYPETHGITGNTYFDRETGERVYMEDPSYLRAETRLERAGADGERVAALVAKDKLRRMVGRGCEIAASAEDPPGWLEAAVGPAPDIYSGEASAWLLAAATHLLDARDLDRLYVSTTDVVPHLHAPAEPAARDWVAAMDDGLAALAARATDLVATADHGMSHKTRCVDVERLLEGVGLDATVVRLIRDRHTYHHQNLGGAAYVYLHAGTDDGVGTDEAADRLAGVEGIDDVLPRAVAAERYRLPPDRIGDLFLLGTRETVFGPLDEGTHGAVDLRSHGSHHEREVPYVSTGDVALDATPDAFDAVDAVDGDA